MTTSEVCLSRIRKRMALVALDLEGENALRRYNGNIGAESLFVGLLNRILARQFPGLRLTNANFCDYPEPPPDGIDLLDPGARLAVQVTTSTKIGKIRDTFDKFDKHAEYDRLLFVYPTMRSPGRGAGTKVNTPTGFDFDLKRDQLSFGDLLQIAETMETDELAKLDEWFEGEVPLAPANGVTLRSLVRELEPDKTNPASLLHAQYGIVPFDEGLCRRELDDLEELCEATESGVGARLLFGPGGVGKTRLLIHFCTELRRQGWNAGFVPTSATAAELRSWVEARGDTLLVFDYAETRPDLEQFLEEAPERKSKGQLRIVLLARGISEWWEELLENEQINGLLAGNAQPLHTPKELDEGSRRTFFDIAKARFEARLKRTGIRTGKVEFEDPLYRNPLYLSMAALAAAEGHSPDAKTVLADTAEREIRYVSNLFEPTSAANTAQKRAKREAVRRLLAAVTLRRGRRHDIQDDSFVADVRGPASDQALRALAGIYPGPEGSRTVGPVEPDILGEQILAATLDKEHHESWLPNALRNSASLEIEYALGLVDRLNDRIEFQNKVDGWIRAVLRIDPIGYATQAIEATKVRSKLTASSRIAAQLAEALPDANITPVPKEASELAEAIESETSQESVSFRELRLWSIQVQIAVLRSAPEDEHDTEEHARLLNNLGGRLSNLGRREDALRATAEAVRSHRQLVEQNSDEFLPDLASSLNNLSVDLSRLGRHEEALEATEEAVRSYCQLAEQRPDAFLPNLATSLNNLGMVLSSLGRLEDALQASAEAVRSYRQLAEQRPDAFLPDLAMSLNNLGIRLSNLGRREEALEATEEAVRSCRQLAEQRPDAFLPNLAMSLSNLGIRLSSLGRREEALQASEEAVRSYRLLAEQRLDAFLPDLAMSLNNLGIRLSSHGRREEALEATEEAMRSYRQLAEQRPDAFLPDLGMILNNLGNQLSNLGRREEALEATEEAVQIRRRLAAQRPDAFLPDLAMSLNNLGVELSDLGRREEALQATEEAVRITSELARKLPSVFGQTLARRTRNLRRQLGNTAEIPTTIAKTLKEAAALLRELGLREDGDGNESGEA